MDITRQRILFDLYKILFETAALSSELQHLRYQLNHSPDTFAIAGDDLTGMIRDLELLLSKMREQPEFGLRRPEVI